MALAFRLFQFNNGGLPLMEGRHTICQRMASRLGGLTYATGSSNGGVTGAYSLSGGNVSITPAGAAELFNTRKQTIAFWVKNSLTSGSAQLTGQGNMTYPNNRGYSIWAYPGPTDLHLSFQDDNDAVPMSYTYGGVLKNGGAWNHICVVNDNGIIITYVNGNELTPRSGQTNWKKNWSAYTADVPLMLPSATMRFDDYRVYDHACSPEEVKDIARCLVTNIDFHRASYTQGSLGATNVTNYVGLSCTVDKSSPMNGGYCNFNGTSSFLTVTPLFKLENSFTWNVWAYMDNWGTHGGNMRLLSCTQSGGWNLGEGATYITAAAYDGSTSTYKNATSSVTWASLTSGWHMFTFKYTSDVTIGAYARLYLDGNLIATSERHTQHWMKYNANNTIFIGAEAESNATTPAATPCYFKGRMADIKCFGTALHDVDIKDLFNRNYINFKKSGVIQTPYISNVSIENILTFQKGKGILTANALDTLEVPVRYIRDTLFGGGSSANSACHWNGIRVYSPSGTNHTASVPSVQNFSYTGSVRIVDLSAGTYIVECWGANGGKHNNSSGTGGIGGYSKGVLSLPSTSNIYIVIGGAGGHLTAGYNGGGSSTGSGGGGGATHIATSTGVLSTLVTNQSAVKIVAGGGGGSGSASSSGGNGGGITGGAGSVASAVPGTQSAPGATNASVTPGGFGYGLTGYNLAGGGGGWYGGGNTSSGTSTTSSGGGSGYIGGVTDGITVQPTESGFVANPDTSGNGYVRITSISGVAISCLNGIINSDGSISGGIDSTQGLLRNPIANNNWQAGGTQVGSEGYQLIDLGAIKYCNRIEVHHYGEDRRIYNGHRLEVSEDGKEWITIADSDLQGRYSEVPVAQGGRTFYLNPWKVWYTKSKVLIGLNQIMLPGGPMYTVTSSGFMGNKGVSEPTTQYCRAGGTLTFTCTRDTGSSGYTANVARFAGVDYPVIYNGAIGSVTIPNINQSGTVSFNYYNFQIV